MPRFQPWTTGLLKPKEARKVKNGKDCKKGKGKGKWPGKGKAEPDLSENMCYANTLKGGGDCPSGGALCAYSHNKKKFEDGQPKAKAKAGAAGGAFGAPPQVSEWSLQTRIQYRTRFRLG